MNGPPLPARRSFSTDVHAAEHLCDHVLTRPETHDWAVVLHGFCDMVDPTDDAGLQRIAASLFTGPACAEARKLLDLYVAAILQNIADALWLGFWWEQRREDDSLEWFGLGLDGIYVIWDQEIIKTAFFRGSVSREPDGEIQPRRENPIPRRDPTKLLWRPLPDSPRRRYRLFEFGHRCFSSDYEKAFAQEKVVREGGGPFVDCGHAPRIGKWKQWLDARPASPSEL